MIDMALLRLPQPGTLQVGVVSILRGFCRGTLQGLMGLLPELGGGAVRFKSLFEQAFAGCQVRTAGASPVRQLRLPSGEIGFCVSK